MQGKSDRSFLGLAAIAVALACGGRTQPGDLSLEAAEAGAGGAAIGSGSASPAASGGSPRPSGLGSSAGPGGAVSPGGSGPPPSVTPPGSGPSAGATSPIIQGTPGDAGCPPASWSAPPPFGVCWNCVARACSDQLTACAADCACSQSLAKALACENASVPLPQCFGPIAMGGGGDPSIVSVAMCLLSASANCACPSGGPGVTRPGTPACPGAGGGGFGAGGGGAGGGTGSCTAETSEACGGVSYQVVCSCPQAACVCFGASTTIVSFPGCPFCPTAGPGPGSYTLRDALALCGFPH
jgi:hypothetical protein